MPTWGLGMAALTIALAALAALRIVPPPVLIVPLLASSISRRFSVTPVHATIDADGLWLGERLAAARSEVLDVWFDAEDRELRITVASKPDRWLVLHVPNSEQARRFVTALLPADHGHRVAGVRPRAIDLLSPLRFVAVAIAWAATARLPGAIVIVLFFAWSAYAFVRGVQIDAGPDALELRTFRGIERIPYADLGRDGARLDTLSERAVRDPLLSSQSWTRRAYERVLAYARERSSTSTDA